MKMASMTSKEFGRRFRKALSVPFMFDQACSEPLQQFVKSYAESVGCNEKCIFFPLLSCCAACMGPNAYLELTANWHEPMIVWSLVVTPMTLRRIDVAEHLKQQLIAVQNELSSVKTENPQMAFSKFMVDVISLDTFQEALRSNDGQAFGMYNTTRALHNTVSAPEHAEIMYKLHSGSSWFSNSRTTKKLVSKTHVNFSILSSPSAVHNSLTTSPHFHEIYNDCFLTICAEENHVKFSQLPATSQCETIQRIFKDIISFHCTNNIVYKLNEDAVAKFSAIHDEISDKAKQLARKSTAKVFYPAISYLARLSCVLHVLDNVLEAINYAVPVDPLTWNCEVSADNVWQARQVLGYVIEQKFMLSQPTMVETTPVRKVVESVVVDDGPGNRVSDVRSNLFHSPHRANASPGRYVPVSPRNSHFSPQRFNSVLNTRMRTVPQRPPASASDVAFDLLLASNNTNNNVIVQNQKEPVISEIRSAGVPVSFDTALAPVDSSVSDVSSVPVNDVLPDPFTEQSIALMGEQEFCQAFKVQIRRVLVYAMKEISVNLCVQLGFAPMPPGNHQSTEQKIAMARVFLKRLEALGFGTIVGTNLSNSKRLTFKKCHYELLGNKQRKLLSDIRVSEREYEKCFKKIGETRNNTDNNSIVCVE